MAASSKFGIEPLINPVITTALNNNKYSTIALIVAEMITMLYALQCTFMRFESKENKLNSLELI
jgi:hypothetical protein